MANRLLSGDQVWLKDSNGLIVTLMLTLIMFSLEAFAVRSNTYYVPYGTHDNAYLADEQLAIFEAKSVMICLLVCNQNEQCKSISYNTLSMTCQHFPVLFWGRAVTETNESGWLNFDSFKSWDCKDLYEQQNITGIYTISPGHFPSFSVNCEMDFDGGGWMIIQRRYDGTIDFQRSWLEYKTGFGDLAGEFWLGNDQIHAITTSAAYELRVDIGDWSGNSWYAVYRTFRVEDENSKYRLTIGDYSGTAGDSMLLHRGMFFSTMDVDNDISPSMHCSNVWGGSGGWWYYACDEASLNGRHAQGSGSHGINWYHAKNSYYSFKLTRMMIRRL